MRTLFKDFSSPAILVIIVLVYFLFPGLSMYSFVALAIAIHQFGLLFNSIGYILPVRYLFGSFMCLQFFIGPVLAFNGVDKYQYPLYRMQVPEDVYFSYAIPGVILFIIGLHITAGDFFGEKIDIERLQEFIRKRKKLPYIFIVIGLITSFFVPILPQAITFILVTLGSLKFVGLFMLILGFEKLKVLPLVIVFGGIILGSLSNAMFHDLLIWLIISGAVMSIKYRPTVLVKITMCVSFIMLSVVIQQLKSTLRSGLREGKSVNLDVISDAYFAQQKDEGIFSFQSLAPHNVRINQGFIITYIMNTVPILVPYSSGGELWQIVEAAIFPRFLAPNKLQAGDRTIFTRYTQIPLDYGTSMSLSSLGDAYVNFGKWGGAIMLLILGLVYSEGIKIFHKHAYTFPILVLLVPVIVYYPIRPDSELQTSLGHFVKSSFIIYLMFRYLKKHFVMPEEKGIDEGEDTDSEISEKMALAELG